MPIGLPVRFGFVRSTREAAGPAAVPGAVPPRIASVQASVHGPAFLAAPRSASARRTTRGPPTPLECRWRIHHGSISDVYRREREPAHDVRAPR